MIDTGILKPVQVLRVNGGHGYATERIIRETPLTLNVNRAVYATAMMTAGMEREFAVGHLLSQGLISKASDITSLAVHGTTVAVTLDPKRTIPPKRVASALVVTHEQVFSCVKAILKSDIFQETEAVHSVGLFLEGRQPSAITEDLGRHHALDKAVGQTLLKGFDPGRTLAASTGRQPAEMIYKCRNAGIPIIATKGVPTSLAIKVAEESGIAIAGLVRGPKMIVYSHPERIR